VQAGGGVVSRRKPHAGDPGYRCSLRTPYGQAVVYDRKGLILPQTVDAAHPRWDVVSYDRQDALIGVEPCRTEREARDTMKGLRDGSVEPTPAEPPKRPRPFRAAPEPLDREPRTLREFAERSETIILAEIYRHGEIPNLRMYGESRELGSWQRDVPTDLAVALLVELHDQMGL